MGENTAAANDNRGYTCAGCRKQRGPHQPVPQRNTTTTNESVAVSDPAVAASQ